MNDGRVMGLFEPGCCQNHGKEMKIERDKAFGAILKNIATSCLHELIAQVVGGISILSHVIDCIRKF